MPFKTLDDLDPAGKRVLVRVDINVPVQDGKVTDATRIEAIVPTVKDITGRGGAAILLAHFGRPTGERVDELSLQQLVPSLEAHLGLPVAFTADDTRAAVVAQCQALEPGAVLLVENTRFYPGEEANDPDFAKRMAAFGDAYVNDAFSAAHRAHASTEGVAHHLPAYAGRLMQAELEALEKALTSPARPVVAVVGGAKVSTKLDLLGNLIEKVDQLVIGGGMANTFLAAQGIEVGKSLCEHDLTGTAKDIIGKAEAAGCEIVLPQDVVVAREFKAGATSETVPASACPADAMILDAGPNAVATIRRHFEAAKTLVWNGPLGAFEIAPFNAATDAAAQAAAALTESGALLSVAGGGDTVAALNASGAAAKFSYVSTAGGAFLEWLEGKTLPGVAALMR
ncbi:MAG: phosphoglycerate kinase [Pseudomonadota bacterium]